MEFLSGAYLYLYPLLFLFAERFFAPPQRGWLTPGWVMDLCFTAVYLVVFTIVVGGITVALQNVYDTYLPFLNTHLLDEQPLWLQAVVIFVLFDLVFYVAHRLQHEVRFLWWFHEVHHSQRQMNPYTHLRGHPLETVYFGVWFSLPLAFLGSQDRATLPVALVVFGAANFLWSFFVHADLRINLGPLKYLLVTPQYHRVHHSLEQQHFDRNFSGRLVLWDYLFGTLYPHFDEYPDTGLERYPVVERSLTPWGVARDLGRHMLHPFVMMATHWFGFRWSQAKTEPAVAMDVTVGNFVPAPPVADALGSPEFGPEAVMPRPPG